MKKILLLMATIVFAVQASNAQTSKGSQTLGINLNFLTNSTSETEFNSFDSTTSVANTKTHDFGIAPTYSYFIADNLDLGASIQYSSQMENNLPINGKFGEKVQTHTYGASVFLRKYFMYANKIGLRTGPYVSYSKDDMKDISTGSNADPMGDLHEKTDNITAGLSLELVYFPAKHLGFSAYLANLNYNHYKMKATPSTNHETGNSFNLNVVNNGVSISVFYVFGGK